MKVNKIDEETESMLDMEMEVDELGNNERLNLQIQQQIENSINFFEIENSDLKQSSLNRKIEFEPIDRNLIPMNHPNQSENEVVIEKEPLLIENESEVVINESILNNRKIKDQTISENKKENSSKSDLEVVYPEFIEGEPDYSKNHVCRKLNKFRCDNSQNYVTQCTQSFLTQQNVRELLLDCRKTISHFSYKRFLGEDYLPISSFGSRSKCIRVKRDGKKSTATCIETFCHNGGTSYSVMFPHLESTLISF